MAGQRVSRRESDVLALLGESLTNAEIADRLVLSERTVESHVSSLLRKLGAANRRELTRLASDGGRLRPEPQPSEPSLPAMLNAVIDQAAHVGRHEELAVMAAQWQRAREGAITGVLLTGDAGMGKTRTAAEFASEVRGQGGRVLLGACYEDVDQPFGPIDQAITADATGLTEEALRARGSSREVLATITPSLARALGLERTRRRAAAPDREAILDAVDAWFTATSSACPTMLVVEDIHWSTSSTQDALRQLLRGSAKQHLLVVATARDTLAARRDGFLEFLNDLRRLPTVVEIALEGLGTDDVAALTGTSIEDADQIRSDTGGNPLLVRYLSRQDGRGDASVDALLASRDALLDDSARDVLDLAAVLGAEFDVDLLTAAHRGGPAAVLAALEAAERAGLLVAPEGAATRFAFAHTLFRSHRYGALPWRRRLELHDRAADAYGQRGDESTLTDHARHACLAVPVGAARLAIDLAIAAGEQAERSYAYEEAAAHYRRGLEAAPFLDPHDPAATLDLVVRHAAALHHGSDPSGLPALVDAADRASRTGHHEALIRAAISLPQFGAPADPTGPDPRLSTIVESALAVLDRAPSKARAQLELFHSQVQQFWDNPTSTSFVDTGTRVEAMARGLNDPDALADVLLQAIHCYSHPSRLDEYARIAIELERLGKETNRLAITLTGINAQAAAARCRGDLTTWHANIERADSLLGTRRMPWYQLQSHAARWQAAFLAGDLQAAETAARDLAPLAVAVGHGPAPWTGAALLAIRRARGEDTQLLPGLHRIAAADGDVSASRCMLAAALARSGDLDAAQRVLAQIRRGDLQVPEEYSWSISLGELAEAAELTGDEDIAAHVITQLGPYPGWLGLTGSTMGRPFDQSLAQAALTTGDTDAAENHATRAVDWSRAQKAPVLLARALVFLAEARRRAGAAGPAVGPLVEEALSLARRHRLRVVETDVARYGLH